MRTVKENRQITAGYNDFVFNFDYFDGQGEDSFSIDDTDVVEYEFINQGNTICVINDGLRLYPGFTQIAPDRWKGTINDFENDMTIYKYKFEPIDFSTVYGVLEGVPLPPNIVQVQVPGFAPYQPFLNEDSVIINRLLVITKVKGQLRGNNVKSPNRIGKNRNR